MPKNLFQDMVKVKRMKREETRLNPPPQTERPLPQERVKSSPIIERRPETTKSPRIKQRSGARKALWFVALVCVVFLAFALSFLFAKAEVTVSPKVKDLALNENLSATADSSDDLSFNLVIISGEESKTVPATGEKSVAQKAEGVVVIYNTFSSSPSLFAVGTRLEGSNGKIYKTEMKTTVPGMKDGKPGSIEVKIEGLAAGAEYNSGPLDFKFASLKGTPKYTKFYARSKGSITGGFKGKAPDVSDSDKAGITEDLKTILEAKLLKAATEQIPTGFILFKNAFFLNVDGEFFTSPSNDNNLLANIKGTFYGILLEEKKLTQKIVQDNIEKYDGSEVYIPNIRSLVFSLTAPAGPVNFNDVKDISFNLSGPAKIVWRVDQAKLVSDLLGKSKKNFNQILSGYPNIDSAQSVVSPFWRGSFPSKSEKIKVIVNYPR